MCKPAALAGVAIACLVALWSPDAGVAALLPAFRVLVFTKITAFRNDSIPAAISAVEGLGAGGGFVVDATVFNRCEPRALQSGRFSLDDRHVLESDQQSAFTRYVEDGGGFVGVHSAPDTEHDWPWYGGRVGAYFVSHPAVQPATIDVADGDTPATIHLPASGPAPTSGTPSRPIPGGR